MRNFMRGQSYGVKESMVKSEKVRRLAKDVAWGWTGNVHAARVHVAGLCHSPAKKRGSHVVQLSLSEEISSSVKDSPFSF